MLALALEQTLFLVLVLDMVLELALGVQLPKLSLRSWCQSWLQLGGVVLEVVELALVLGLTITLALVPDLV